MRDLRHIDKYRVPLFGVLGDEYNGCFILPTREGIAHVIASNGEGWEHVSVSLKHKTPSWETMCDIKEMFFEDDETVLQYHPPKSEYVNIHKYCLHLWKPIGIEIPRPSKLLV